MIKSTKAFLLAGASALAILASAAGANAETFTVPGRFSFTASVSGEYAVELLGASGGPDLEGGAGGPGAFVSGDIFLTAGEDLALFVGGQGGSGFRPGFGGGGGGGSFVFHGTDVLAVAGGGGGAASDRHTGGSGLAGKSGGAGAGDPNGGGGGHGGVGGTGGDAGLGAGGGGAGVKSGPAGYGGDAVDPGVIGGFGGKFPTGGAAAVPGGSGGYGGGGGGGPGGGGGGSGFSGGGGGFGGGHGGGGYGGGGGSYLASLFTDPVLTAGVNSGDGSISITQLPGATVPESSTWAMTLMGFAGLGWLARTRGRKTSPA
jgi:hypothetical protein